jgi:iron complex transport system substrate-binding protein
MSRRVRRTSLWTLVGVLLAVFVGCDRNREPPSPQPARTPQRIVSLSPNMTETLFALGAGARLVGRSRYCDYPPEAAALPIVGGFVDASFEAILGLVPDLVVGARGPAGRALTDRLEAVGIPTFFPQTESMAEIDSMVIDLGAKIGSRERAATLVERMRTRRATITAALREAPRPRALFVVGLNPIAVAGAGSFPDEMLRLVAAENVIDTGGSYPTVGIEHLLRLDPDVIVDATAAETGAGRRSIGKDEPGWRELRAVKEGRIRPLAGDATVRPGPRIADGLAALARAIHPESQLP